MVSNKMFNNYFVMEDPMRRIAFISLWLTVFSFPWQNLLATQYGTISRYIGIFAMVICGISILMLGRIKKIKSYYILVFLFVLWIGISQLWAINQQDSIMLFLTYLQHLIFIWLIYEFINTEHDFISLLYAYLLGCFITSLNNIYNFLISNDIYSARFVVEGYSANYLAYTISFGLPLAWYLFKKGYYPRIALSYIPIGVFSVIITGSRTAFIGLIVFMTFLLIHILKKQFRYKKRLLFFIALLAILIYPNIPEPTISRLMTTGTEVSEGDLNNRTIIWSSGIESYKDGNPLLGKGIGSFKEITGTYLNRSATAHNVYLSLLVELGIIGIILFSVIFIFKVNIVLKLEGNEKWLWTTLLIMWFIYSNMATIENEKMTWLIFGLIPLYYYHFIEKKTEINMNVQNKKLEFIYK